MRVIILLLFLTLASCSSHYGFKHLKKDVKSSGIYQIPILSGKTHEIKNQNSYTSIFWTSYKSGIDFHRLHLSRCKNDYLHNAFWDQNDWLIYPICTYEKSEFKALCQEKK